MKKLFTIFLLYATFCTQAQGPVIEATYFPVVNTKIKQVWDITTGSLTVPGTGENKVWDYRITNGQFTNPIDTTSMSFWILLHRHTHQCFQMQRMSPI